MWSGRTYGSKNVEFLVSMIAFVLGLVLVAALLIVRVNPPAQAGVGDPYYPSAGGSGYDATAYVVDVAYDPDSGQTVGSTWITLTARQALTTIHLDLMLTADHVTVGGVEVKFTQQGDDLAIPLATVAGLPTTRAGAILDIQVFYHGDPSSLRFPTQSPVYRTDSELLISGEPESASAWFPVNDHPRDPALYDISVSVPEGVEAISVGSLVRRGPDPNRPGRDQWHWVTNSPAPSYTTMLAIGQYVVTEETVQVSGVDRQAVYAVSEQIRNPDRALAWLRRTPGAIEAAEKYLGAYPMDAIGGLVPGVEPWWGGLETIARPVYHPNVIGSDSVLLHEIIHMWLGDTVTLNEWASLFNNESLTSYIEWITVGERGGADPQQRFDQGYDKAQDSFWTQKLSDPGPGERMFARVYDRGAMVVHALRTRMGDDAFFAFMKSWAGQQGPRTLDQFKAAAQAASPVDLQMLFASWLDGTTKPARTAENGFRV